MSDDAEHPNRTDNSGPVVVLGSGFVGSVIARRIGEHSPVTVMSRSTHPDMAVPGDLARTAILSEVERTGATAVLNCVGLLRGTDAEMTAANVEWPTWLAHDVVAGTDLRFVHLGSAAEYGDPGSDRPISETATPNPAGIYGESKWAGSSSVLAARADGLDAVVARGFNFVGPHLSPVSPLYQFLSDVTALGTEGGTVEIWWPDTLRDFILLDDLATAIAALTRVPEVPDIVNLCSGVGVTFGAIVEAMARRQAKTVSIRSLDRPGIRSVVGDNSRLRAVCGFAPEMSAELVAEFAEIDPPDR